MGPARTWRLNLCAWSAAAGFLASELCARDWNVIHMPATASDFYISICHCTAFVGRVLWYQEAAREHIHLQDDRGWERHLPQAAWSGG